MKFLWVLLVSLLLVGCSSSGKENYAPVVNANSFHSYTVNQETQSKPVYNHPRIQQKPVVAKRPAVRQKPRRATTHHRKTVRKVNQSHKKPARRIAEKRSNWSWPARGKVVKAFSSSNAGINIQGKPGEPIRAAQSGEVIYSQMNVRDYGNLLIIKHKNGLLTAYAHNQKLLVKAGDRVKKGQKIATMGKGPNKKGLLHFEVRKNGQPVNPKGYLG